MVNGSKSRWIVPAEVECLAAAAHSDLVGTRLSKYNLLVTSSVTSSELDSVTSSVTSGDLVGARLSKHKSVVTSSSVEVNSQILFTAMYCYFTTNLHLGACPQVEFSCN